MSTLTIRTQNKCNTTTIENHFIDAFMPRANGEFVKIYLYLIRIMNDPSCAVTLTKIADTLEHTEKDILRAFHYWEREGLLSMSWDNNQNITAIDIVPASSIPKNQNVTSTDVRNGQALNLMAEPATTILPDLTNTIDTSVEMSISETPAEPVEINSYKARKDFKQVMFITETYLGKTLSKSEVDMITYFYDTLGFPIELIEYLIEYCVENGHKSMHYINAVANNWSKAGVLTVEAAKQQILGGNKSYYIILRSFGITGRSPIQMEAQLMDKWMNEFGFSLEIINEACTKTIASIQTPNFNYADTILTNWKKQGVRFVEDINRLDKEFIESRAKAPTPKASVITTTKPTTNNFKQRNYDMDAIQQRLLNAK